MSKLFNDRGPIATGRYRRAFIAPIVGKPDTIGKRSAPSRLERVRASASGTGDGVHDELFACGQPESPGLRSSCEWSPTSGGVFVLEAVV